MKAHRGMKLTDKLWSYALKYANQSFSNMGEDAHEMIDADINERKGGM